MEFLFFFPYRRGIFHYTFSFSLGNTKVLVIRNFWKTAYKIIKIIGMSYRNFNACLASVKGNGNEVAYESYTSSTVLDTSSWFGDCID